MKSASLSGEMGAIAEQRDLAGWAGTADLFERFPYGLVLADRTGQVLRTNQKARELFEPARIEGISSMTCCDLICHRISPGLGEQCLTERLIDGGSLLPEIRFDIERNNSRGAAWVTTSMLDDAGMHLLFHLRPGAPGDRRQRIAAHGRSWSLRPESPKLHIATFGQLRIEREGRPIVQEWLTQRPGQLLKFLICERGRVVSNEQIAEALWPDAGHREADTRIRYYVHALRDKLEPMRTRRSPSQFVVAHRGGYMLDMGNAWIDADTFEAEACAGLAAFTGRKTSTVNHLENALRLYRDDFLAEDPYEEWTLDERDRLRELAGRVLRALIDIEAEAGRLESAAAHARKLSEMEPFDMDVQRIFIGLCLQRGRRSEAVRRYAVLRQRMLRTFDQEPDFTLATVETDPIDW
ncbi:MAG TPA: BTAD domain-containing putative transcriptional regulator [Solirubrobacterales bacterium]|nr:BTAD domain-containing putative transcriptional regulator [Solirubrobacterales bacterium]